MEKFLKKAVAITILMLSILVISNNVFAANENIQIVKTDTDNIVYVKGMEKKDFRFASSKEELDPDSLDLSYVNALQDDDGNNVAVVDSDAKYLYIKNGETKVVELDLGTALTKTEYADIEKITNRIKTETIAINQKDEQVGEVKYEETVGGLKITDDANGEYEYSLVKLPADKYSDLKTLVKELNDSYAQKDSYSKIEFAKELSELFAELVDDASFSKVEDMQVLQPEDSKKGDEYVVLLKKTVDGKTTYDAKFMTSDRTEVEPEKYEKKEEVKSTALLPKTGDSLVLFIILAIVIVVMIVVFVRIKKLQKKDQK